MTVQTGLWHCAETAAPGAVGNVAVAVIAFCFLWLFPRISPLMPWGDNTVDNGAQSPSSTAPIHPGGPL